MQFLVIGRDGADSEALNRRMAVRQAHIELGDKMRAQGKMLFGVAILDDSDKMVGSMLVCNFESRSELDDWLRIEPYVTGGVWQDVQVQSCKVGPTFLK